MILNNCGRSVSKRSFQHRHLRSTHRGRYGSTLPSSELSVTNGEFLRAAELKIPVFALVEQDTCNDYLFYWANMTNPELIAKFQFPNADSPRIFEFIDSVQSRAANNAIVPFVTASDAESYLRSQWAGLMHDFLPGSLIEH